jgi:uncharacterized membrane protein
MEAVAVPPVSSSIQARLRTRILTPQGLVSIAATTWAVGFAGVCVVMFDRFLNRRFDLGNMTQAVWSTAHGHPLEVTAASGEQITRLAVHVDPILALFVPLWWIWSSPLVLMVVQAGALAIGALPVFWFASKRLPSERAAAYLALAYLSYPALQWRAMNDFHPTNIGVPLLLFAIWYLDEERLAMFAVFAAAALGTQEQMGLVIAGIGLVHAVRARRPKLGVAIAALGIGWSTFCFGFVIPHFAHGANPNTSRFEGVGGSASGILLTIVNHPLRIVEALHSNDLIFLLIMGAPFLGLFMLAPEWLLPAAPQLALPLLSARATDTTINNHLFSPVIPFLIIASVVGISRLGRYSEHGARLILAASALSLVIGPWQLLQGMPVGQTARVRAADAAVALVSDDEAVSSTNFLGSKVSDRRHVYTFPVVTRAKWVIVDETDPLLPPPRAPGTGLSAPVYDLTWQPARLKSAIAAMKRDPEWVPVFSRSGILVWHRRSTSKSGSA